MFNFDKFNKDLAKKLDKLKLSLIPDGNTNSTTKTLTPKVKATKIDNEEIKINPYDYFKEDVPNAETKSMAEINKTLERNSKVFNLKQQIEQNELQLKALRTRLVEAEKEFKEATTNSNMIAKVSKINMIKEDIRNVENVKKAHIKALAELTEE